MDCPAVGSQIDIPAATVSGKVTVNGARTADDSHGAGYLSLVRSSAGVTVDAGSFATTSPEGGAYSALVVPGTYDVVYSGGSGSVAPVNTSAVLRSGVVIGTAPLTLDIDVPATTVTLTATIKGAAMTAATPFRQGGLALVNAAGDNALLTGNAASRGAYTALVVPGTYDLVYSGDELSGGMPVNSAATIQKGILVGTAGAALQADVPATKVSMTVTVNGAVALPPTASIIDMSLRTPAGDVAQLVQASSTSNSLSAYVVPGTYDLYYAISTVSEEQYHATKIRSGIVVGTSALAMAVDVTATPFSCTVTVNGAPLSSDAGVDLQGASGELYHLAGDGSPTLVLPDSYDLVYQGYAAFGTGLPLNRWTPLRTGIVVAATPVALTVDVPAVTVSGAVTVNGSPRASNAMGSAFLTLVGAAGGSCIISGVTPSYSTVVVAGTYDLTYQMNDEAADLPENTHALVKKGLVIGTAPSPLALDVDLSAVALAPTVTVNGAAIEGASGPRGVLQLYGSNGDVASFASVSAQPSTLPPALVVPGTYDLYYRVYSGGPTIPINSHGYLGCVTVR